MNREREVALEGCGARTTDLASRAHYQGETAYLTLLGRRLAAIVPVGYQATSMPGGTLDAAYRAAFSGLPSGMNEEEARRRLTAALNAAYPHLADAMDSAERRGADRAMSEAWRRFDPNEEEPDNPAADALARHIADHPVSTIQAAMRILGWKVSFNLVVPESDENN